MLSLSIIYLRFRGSEKNTLEIGPKYCFLIFGANLSPNEPKYEMELRESILLNIINAVGCLESSKTAHYSLR